MLFSAALTATLLASAYAAPTLVSRDMTVNSGTKAPMTLKKSTSQNSSASKGAVYMITNEPSGNFVVAADINADGSLTLATAMATGGAGQHGNAEGPDPLFGQGAVKANANASMLATVNAGSNTISLFSIDPKNPTSLKAVGQPISSGGEFPQSVAFNAAGDMLCTLNGGALDGVQCFSVNGTAGLTPMANTRRNININQTTPATGPAGTASHLIFSEDQKTVFAAVKGNPDANFTGFLAAWDIQEDGSLSEDFTKITLPDGGALPFAISNIAGSNGSLFVADAGVGADVFDLKKGVNNASKSNATATIPVEGQGAVCWTAFSSKISSFFVSDIKTSLITEIAVDPSTLNSTVIKQYKTQDGAGTIDLETATVNDKDFLYVNMANATSIAVFALPAQGQAKMTQTLDVGKAAAKAGLPISGNNVQGMTVFLAKSN
ncbi:hypothetical protein PENSPDRAFT_644501 [Peniophora sp. CONT]|nr:hypothetical protein PENSPDRAFT_644501 [Peniophora sp. CONT]